MPLNHDLGEEEYKFGSQKNNTNIVDGSEILHQLRFVAYSVIYKFFYIPGAAGFLRSTVFQARLLELKFVWEMICFFDFFGKGISSIRS